MVIKHIKIYCTLVYVKEEVDPIFEDCEKSIAPLTIKLNNYK